jgi:diguanylate cyclase (GGDEF)-like protein
VVWIHLNFALSEEDARRDCSEWRGGAELSVLDAHTSSRLISIWDELVGGLNVGMLCTDERGQVLATNEVAADLMQLDKSDLLTGARPPGWQVWDDTGAPMPDWADLAGQVLRAGVPLSTPLVIGRHGRPLTRVWADYRPVRARGRDRVLVLLQPVHTDISHTQGLLDPLTGLPGRALLLDRVEQALVRARTSGTLATLVLVDIHQLATVNKEHGFETGDQVLCMVATRLREGMSDDRTVARYGADEFAVLAEHSNGTGERIAEQARDLTSWPMVIRRKRIRTGLRVAWVTSAGHAPAHTVLAHAEDLLSGGSRDQ